jgi:hypothetical protein
MTSIGFVRRAMSFNMQSGEQYTLRSSPHTTSMKPWASGSSVHVSHPSASHAAALRVIGSGYLALNFIALS